MKCITYLLKKALIKIRLDPVKPIKESNAGSKDAQHDIVVSPNKLLKKPENPCFNLIEECLKAYACNEITIPNSIEIKLRGIIFIKVKS